MLACLLAYLASEVLAPRGAATATVEGRVIHDHSWEKTEETRCIGGDAADINQTALLIAVPCVSRDAALP